MKYLLRSALAIVAIAVTAACGGGGGGDDDPQGPGGPTNMSAVIDGEEWSALGNATRGINGLYSIVGINVAEGRTINISLYNIDSPGTYILGAGVTMVGGTGIVSYSSGEGWATPINGVAGSITITTLTATRMAGTFHYTTTPLTGGATGNIEVEDGEFDMLVGGSAPFGPLPDYLGTSLSGTIGGQPFVAGVAGIGVAGGIVALNANNGTANFSITMASVTTTGSYPLSLTAPARQMAYMSDAVNINAPMWGNQTADAGSVTITRFDVDRIEGTFTATLNPANAAATTPLVLTGSFSFGRVHAP